ncbi:MAG: type I DNA topoisomerase [Candidatus Margulisiibacteriota bacterium]
MPKNLVIVESPAKAKTILKFLGKDYDIKASYGHVRDLPDRKLGVDLKKEFEPTYQVMKDKEKVIKEIKDAAKKSETVYLATDPDREGEAIAWHIKEATQLPDDKVKRIVFHEITEKAIKQAILSSRNIDRDLVDAQQARRILDRLIGYKLSPILSKKIRRGLSAGRVQSVAVKLLCDREKEILAFVPKEFWHIDGDFVSGTKRPFKARLFALDTEKNKIELNNQTEADAVLKALKEANYDVQEVKKSPFQRQPQPPFITSTLQQEASRKLNWTAKRTMVVAQQLYEGVDIEGEPVGLITYMRTDSFRISDEARSAAKAFITKTYGTENLPEKDRHYKTSKNAQDAHEAIRPTYLNYPPDQLEGKLSADLMKLYKLIWARFIASQMRAAQGESTQIQVSAKTSGKNYLFKATGSVITFEGFTKVYTEGKDEVEEQEALLPSLEKGESLKGSNIEGTQKFTQPPARYTEATLVKEMEEKGIGRPSTYAPTLSTIQDRGYVDKEKRNLIPTELGMVVNDQLSKYFNTVVEVNFTADMERQLDEIMEGKHVWQQVIADYYNPLTSMITKADQEMEKIKTDKPTDEICEKCGSPVVIKNGRFGEFKACSNYPACKNTKSIVVTVDVNCPVCSKPIVEKRSKKGKLFYGCSGYPSCTFAAWDKPVAQTCPTCNYGVMLVKDAKGKTGQPYCPVCNPPKVYTKKAKSSGKKA